MIQVLSGDMGTVSGVGKETALKPSTYYDLSPVAAPCWIRLILVNLDPQTRTFAAVLFRRIATKTRKDPVTNEAKELFSTLSGEQRLVIRQKLVSCLTTESGSDVRKKIGDAVAEVARQYTDNGMPNFMGGEKEFHI